MNLDFLDVLSQTNQEPSKECGNPSRRRDGLAIEFSCENCPAILELTIKQHKGETFFAWRYKLPSSTHTLNHNEERRTHDG